jgi:septum formation protein
VTLPKIILASASPRRRELLDLVGIAHSVVPADIDESMVGTELPAAHAERLAREKAMIVAERNPDSLVIAADTIVVIGDRILGKPRTEQEAASMLARLSGETHTVVTGMACALNGRLESSVDDVSVTFRPMTGQEIEEYVATGEPMDKAGAYGIQGFGATIVRRIDGDYFAVMGLSLVRLVGLMERLGVRYHFGGATRST